MCHKSNGGLSATRNEEIRMSKGSYISFVGGDDFFHPSDISFMMENMEAINRSIKEYEMPFVDLECLFKILVV